MAELLDRYLGANSPAPPSRCNHSCIARAKALALRIWIHRAEARCSHPATRWGVAQPGATMPAAKPRARGRRKSCRNGGANRYNKDMKFASTERVFSWATAIALVCVLAALGVLQYRWSGEVSEAATTRMQANLQSSLMDFRQDLSRELARICLEMQEANPGTAPDGKHLAQKLRHWQRTASHPGLVANVYLWNPPGEEVSGETFEHGGEGQPEENSPRKSKVKPPLLRLADDHLQPAAWPAGFLTLRNRLQAISLGMPAQPEPAVPEYREGSPSALMALPTRSAPMRLSWVVDLHIPALVYPMQRTRSATAPLGWLIVELDENLLRQHILPELAERYLGDASGLVYQVAVVDSGGRQKQMIYSSDPEFGERGEIGHDASLNLFGPPYFQLGATHARVDFHRPRSIVARERFAPHPGNDLEGSFIRLDPFHYTAEERDWEIIVKHRKGSMEAAVAGMRRRNLALSFGVLLVLGATMGLIVFTSQRARRLAHLQMDFVAGVSHELRTPLTVISSAAENIADGVIEDRKQITRYGTVIRNQARQLTDLIEQVLGFAALRQQFNRAQLHPLRVTDAIDAALQNTASAIEAAGTTVERDIDPNLPPVTSDPTVLAQCLQNLITNAVKYGGDHRWLGIRAWAVAGSKGAAEVAVTVEDRGIGIAGSELKNIFQPFYRSPAVAESHIRGTGLGLSLARACAESIGCTLTVGSVVGQGSSFTIHLPVANEALPESSRALDIRGDGKMLADRKS